eukprot:1019508-Rhodomonas_salina.1
MVMGCGGNGGYLAPPTPTPPATRPSPPSPGLLRTELDGQRPAVPHFNSKGVGAGSLPRPAFKLASSFDLLGVGPI